MGFDEALERFIRTKPSELEGNVKGSKQKKPPGSMADHIGAGYNALVRSVIQ